MSKNKKSKKALAKQIPQTPKAPKPEKSQAPQDMPKPPKSPLLDVNGAPLHWLVRPNTIKLLWLGGIVLLAFVTWLGTTVHPHEKFGMEGSLGFYSWYGFATCVAMVVFAKLLGFVLNKKDTYYDQ